MIKVYFKGFLLRLVVEGKEEWQTVGRTIE